MNTQLQSMSVLGKLFLAMFLVAIFTGISSCASRIEAPSGQFVRSTQTEPKPNNKLLVFVHGFIGDRDTTWTYEDKNEKVYWPKLVASDPELHAFDIYVASYFTKLLKPGKMIHELASDLNDDLEQQGVFKNYDGVYFVAHSMGNLIVRDAMLDFNKYRDVRVPLIVSFGAPSNGADIAKLCAFALSNKQCQSLVPEDNNDWLVATNDHWKGMYSSKMEVACAYETLDTPGLGRIVDRGSATSICMRMPPKPIGATHSAMVKPKNIKDPIHLWLREQLLATPDRTRVAPYRVLLIDSPLGVYDKSQEHNGRLNMHQIEEVLRQAAFPTIIDELPVYDNWQDYKKALDRCQPPNLVIVHFSSLYGKTALGDPEGRLQTFLSTVLRETKAKIIVYSRWDVNFVLNDGSKLGDMDEFVKNKIAKNNAQHRQRLQTLDVMSFDNPSFQDARVAEALRERVRRALDLP